MYIRPCTYFLYRTNTYDLLNVHSSNEMQKTCKEWSPSTCLSRDFGYHVARNIVYFFNLNISRGGGVACNQTEIRVSRNRYPDIVQLGLQAFLLKSHQISHVRRHLNSPKAMIFPRTSFVSTSLTRVLCFSRLALKISKPRLFFIPAFAIGDSPLYFHQSIHCRFSNNRRTSNKPGRKQGKRKKEKKQ